MGREKFDEVPHKLVLVTQAIKKSGVFIVTEGSPKPTIQSNSIPNQLISLRYTSLIFTFKSPSHPPLGHPGGLFLWSIK
jgi:hypothetical protein